jgi:signal transduction histidine kinase
MDTQFAPAERASNKEILTQAESLVNSPLPSHMFDMMPNIVLILNKHRQIVFANKVCLDLLGKADASHIIGLRPGEALDCIYPAGSEGGCGTTRFCKHCGAVKAILDSQLGKKAVEECQLTRNQDGKTQALDLLVWANPCELNHEQFTVFAVTDISHEKRRRALERIFFHDVINTAGGIKGFIEFIVNENAYISKDDLLMIYEFSSKLLDEIMAQKELITAENNELPVTPADINSMTFIKKMVLMYENHEVAKGKHIVISEGVEAVDFNNDPIILGRVIGNLIKNALEATSPGGTVAAGCNKIENKINFWVFNRSYIPEDCQLQMFKRSFSTKGAGRGLGTYSIKLLTEHYLSGNVSFSSSPENGTTFNVSLPL